MKNIKLSVALLTFNEEKNIADCLESVKWADEIVIVDETSSDNTVNIAKKFTSNIIIVDHDTNNPKGSKKQIDSQGHDTMFHKNKQKAIDNCHGEWILQIDADERISSELKEEITSIINQVNSANSGYEVPRKNYIFGKWIEHSGWYPDYQVKLFLNGKGHFPCKTVHEMISIDGSIGKLKGNLIHNHYTSVSQFLDRLNKYTSNDARYIFEKGETVKWTDAILFPSEEFFKRYFLWEGFKDGLHGLVLSLLQSLSRLVVFAKLWELQGFQQTNIEIKDFEKEVSGVKKKYIYWLLTSKISKEDNLLNRYLLKIKRKLQ